MDRPQVVVVTGTRSLGAAIAAQMVLVLQAQVLQVVVAETPHEPKSGFPELRDPWPSAPSWEQGGRKRAQWKTETNKRGRNR